MMSLSFSSAWLIRVPLTNVPLWLPRSMIWYRPVGDCRSSACCLETPRSDTTMSLSGRAADPHDLRGQRHARGGPPVDARQAREDLGFLFLDRFPDQAARYPRGRGARHGGQADGRRFRGSCGSNLSTGPSSGLPIRTTQLVRMSTRRVCSVPTKMPLRLPVSSRTHPAPSVLSTA